MSPRAALAALCLAIVATACAPQPAARPATAPAGDAVAATGPAVVERSCRVAADCTVKNVGNCCGYQPACVNRDAAVDPDAVRAACDRAGMASVCGWQEIQACDCVQARCEAIAGPVGRQR